MRNIITLVFLFLLFLSTAGAQTVAIQSTAEQIVQPSQSNGSESTAPQPSHELRIPAGTFIEVEVAYTVNSLDVKPGERISFRVLVPLIIDGVTAIERDALVTARVTQAKRGGHWGKGGKLMWSMEDVVAADNTRVPLAPEISSGAKLWSLETSSQSNAPAKTRGSVKGTSHAGEVATMAAISGVLFPPLALLGGFKRGENAILREGRRYVVAVGKDSIVRVTKPVTAP